MQSLVIDLRGNPGGLLVSAVEVVDRFVDRGIIVSTRGRSAQEDFTYSAHEQGKWQVPLVVIIDQDSASAAEIFAGAIRDHHRGTIVGVRSFGKGSVQGIFPLEDSNAGDAADDGQVLLAQRPPLQQRRRRAGHPGPARRPSSRRQADRRPAFRPPRPPPTRCWPPHYRRPGTSARRCKPGSSRGRLGDGQHSLPMPRSSGDFAYPFFSTGHVRG